MILFLIFSSIATLTLWIGGQVFLHFFGDKMVHLIELWEAEWQLHTRKRNRQIQSNKKRIEAATEITAVEEVAPADAPQQWAVYYGKSAQGESTSFKTELIEIKEEQYGR